MKRFYETGSTAKIQAKHADKAHDILQALDVITSPEESPEEMKFPGWSFHPLCGDLKGHYAIKVSGNWRIIFSFNGRNVTLVDYLDYH